MSEKDNQEIAPLGFGFSYDIDQKPMSVAEAREQLDIGVNIIKAGELVDTTFLILGARPFQSGFENQDFAYFCECTDLKHQEVWGTVIGGGQPVQFLTDYIERGAPAPLVVTLREHKGGRFGRYYIME